MWHRYKLLHDARAQSKRDLSMGFYRLWSIKGLLKARMAARTGRTGDAKLPAAVQCLRGGKIPMWNLCLIILIGDRAEYGWR